MTITQTTEVTANRRIFLDLPLELPIGRAKLAFTVIPETVPQTTTDSKINLTKQMKEKLLQGETLRSLTGILHTDMSLEEIRKERLSKYLK